MATILSAFDLDTALATVNDVALYLTIAIFSAFVIFGVLIKVFRKDSFKTFFKFSTTSLSGYLLGILSIFFSLKYIEYQSEGYIDPTTFWPIVALFLFVALLAVIGVALWTAKPKALKGYTKISLILVGLYSLSLIIYRMVLDFQSGTFDATTQALLYILTAVIVAVLILISFLFGKKKDVAPTKSIAFAAVTVATSFALSYIRFFELPQGGSITLASLVPVMIYAYLFGMRKGLIVGALYGLLQFIQAPWFYHPMQFLLDYPIAFAAIALVGLFKELKLFQKFPAVQFVLGAVFVAIIRYFAHVISGIYVFGSGDPDNYSAVAWSFLYNAFVFADIAIAIVAGGLLFSSKTFLHQLEQTAQSVNLSN